MRAVCWAFVLCLRLCDAVNGSCVDMARAGVAGCAARATSKHTSGPMRTGAERSSAAWVAAGSASGGAVAGGCAHTRSAVSGRDAAGLSLEHIVQMRGNPEVKQIPWDTNDEWLQAWENGRTGCAPPAAHCKSPCPRACQSDYLPLWSASATTIAAVHNRLCSRHSIRARGCTALGSHEENAVVRQVRRSAATVSAPRPICAHTVHAWPRVHPRCSLHTHT